jgi:hypothetical protein
MCIIVKLLIILPSWSVLTSLDGVDQCNLPWVWRTSSNTSLDPWKLVQSMIWIPVNGNIAIILFTLGSWIMFQIKLVQLSYFMKTPLTYGMIFKNISLELIVFTLHSLNKLYSLVIQEERNHNPIVINDDYASLFNGAKNSQSCWLRKR